MTPQEFIPKALQAAKDSGHLFPEFAVCEAAEESAWGSSGLSKYNNLFGQKFPKAHIPFPYPFVDLPTHEWDPVKKQMVPTTAHWPVFPDWATSFRERMNLLHRLSGIYGDALAATTGEQFVIEVSKHWSTDPRRADNVLAIYNAHRADLGVA